MYFTKQILLIASFLSLFTSCSRQAPKYAAKLNVAAKDTVRIQKPIVSKEPVDDGSFERFMDSLLDKKGITYDAKPVRSGEEWYFDKEWGPTQKEPKTFYVGNTTFPMYKMDIVNDDARLNSLRYEVDTTIKFSLHGKKYAYARAHVYMCNGSGCRESFYFICDYQYHRMHVFEMMDIPGGPDSNYFCDINGDGKLDFIAIQQVRWYDDKPGHDSTDKVAIIPYTINKAGYFVHMRSEVNNKEMFLIGSYKGDEYTPYDFRIIAGIW